MSESEFDRQFHAAEPRLVSWCHLRIPPNLRARLDPDDVVQECWIRARRGFADFDPERASFSTWLIGIARNVCSETMRKVDLARVRAEAFDSRLDGPNVQGGRSTLSLRGRLAREETFVRLLESLQALSPEEQELIARLGIEKTSCAEVATSWGSTEDAVSKRWQRLRARLATTDRVREFLGVE
jgi:RNA polymerase sigma-70 factor (ECF subfamily)